MEWKWLHKLCGHQGHGRDMAWAWDAHGNYAPVDWDAQGNYAPVKGHYLPRLKNWLGIKPFQKPYDPNDPYRKYSVYRKYSAYFF